MMLWAQWIFTALLTLCRNSILLTDWFWCSLELGCILQSLIGKLYSRSTSHDFAPRQSKFSDFIFFSCGHFFFSQWFPNCLFVSKIIRPIVFKKRYSIHSRSWTRWWARTWNRSSLSKLSFALCSTWTR